MTGICGWFLAFLFFLGAECICRCLVSLWFVLRGSCCLCSVLLMGMADRGTAACVCPGFPGCISAYQAVGVSGKISWKTFCKQGIFLAKTGKKVGGHGAEAGY